MINESSRNGRDGSVITEICTGMKTNAFPGVCLGHPQLNGDIGNCYHLQWPWTEVISEKIRHHWVMKGVNQGESLQTKFITVP